MKYLRRVLIQRILLRVSVATNLICIFLICSKFYANKQSGDIRYSEICEIYKPGTLSVLMMEFEPFENRIQESVNSFGVFDEIMILSESAIYPHLNIMNSNVRTVVTDDLFSSNILYNLRPEYFLTSEYTLIVPDGISLDSSVTVLHLIELYSSLTYIHNTNIEVVVFPVEQVKCHTIQFKLREWTLQYLTNGHFCNYVIGKHVIMMKTEHFLKIEKPYLRPVFESIYIQLSAMNAEVVISDKYYFSNVKTLYNDPHMKLKHELNSNNRKRYMFKQLGIKLIQYADGREEWYGCDKNTARCFGTIHVMPEYLYKQRWTPPCCLKHLRDTASYVFEILQSQKVRYWLEGGSLLGAVRNGDIIPWDYDVDVGIYKSDIRESVHLSKAMKSPYEDEHGFVWTKATEGDFYRVHFSTHNHLHVDIFPFYPKNGVMTKDSWFKDHIQDTEFPEHFLQPRVEIDFAGRVAMAPNKAKEFLELKFGKGVIETPKYPNFEDVRL